MGPSFFPLIALLAATIIFGLVGAHSSPTKAQSWPDSSCSSRFTCLLRAIAHFAGWTSLRWGHHGPLVSARGRPCVPRYLQPHRASCWTSLGETHRQRQHPPSLTRTSPRLARTCYSWSSPSSTIIDHHSYSYPLIDFFAAGTLSLSAWESDLEENLFYG